VAAPVFEQKRSLQYEFRRLLGARGLAGGRPIRGAILLGS